MMSRDDVETAIKESQLTTKEESDTLTTLERAVVDCAVSWYQDNEQEADIEAIEELMRAVARLLQARLNDALTAPPEAP